MKKELICIFILIFNYHIAKSCTLWGAVGSSVTGGGLLIAKNRDWNENSKTSLKIITPKKGFKFLAMYARGDGGGVRGGINEKGLVVFTASASSVRKENRESENNGKIRKILSECKSVNDVVKSKDVYLFGKTEFLMIGDNRELACIEISPENKIHIERKRNGTLYHTNHYIYKKFTMFNEKKNESSIIRHDRICELLESKESFNLHDMKEISNDKQDSKNNNIWRDGSLGNKTRTLMNMSIYIPINDFPRMYTKIANKHALKKSGELVLDNDFWKRDGNIELE